MPPATATFNSLTGITVILLYLSHSLSDRGTLTRLHTTGEETTGGRGVAFVHETTWDGGRDESDGRVVYDLEDVGVLNFENVILSPYEQVLLFISWFL